MFCAMRPKWCVLTGWKMTHSICVCTAHQKFFLVFDAMDWNLIHKDLIKKVVCNIESNKCIMHRCESWHCNSERISWSGIQRTWRWLEISLLSVGNNGPSDTDNLYSHLQRIQRDFDCCYWWLSKTFLYRNAKNYQFLIQDGI